MKNNKALIEMREKARELAKNSELGIFAPYQISCGTLIQLLDSLEYWRNKAEEDKKPKRKKTFILD